ncbi:MAG: purine-binding chemotaxis protein CheW, partial [bacterium]
METVQLVTFEVGKELFGIEVLKIQEVIKYDQVTPTPGSVELIEGVIDLRGDIIPIIDLHKRFDLEIPKDFSKTKILIVEIQEYIFGFIVGKVNEVCNFNLQDFNPPPPGTTQLGSEYTIGVGRKNERLFIFLDVDRVVDILELTQEEPPPMPGKGGSIPQITAQEPPIIDIAKNIAVEALKEFIKIPQESTKVLHEATTVLEEPTEVSKEPTKVSKEPTKVSKEPVIESQKHETIDESPEIIVDSVEEKESIDVTFHQESQEELVSENIKEAQEQDDQKNSGKSEIIEQL